MTGVTRFRATSAKIAFVMASCQFHLDWLSKAVTFTVDLHLKPYQ